MKRFLFVLLLMFVFGIGYQFDGCQTAYAADVTFAWTANTETDLAGYRIFQRSAGEIYDYTSPIAEIPAGTEICTIAKVPDGDWRWVLRAFDATGNESGDSNECNLAIDDPPASPVGFG